MFFEHLVKLVCEPVCCCRVVVLSSASSAKNVLVGVEFCRVQSWFAHFGLRVSLTALERPRPEITGSGGSDFS